MRSFFYKWFAVVSFILIYGCSNEPIVSDTEVNSELNTLNNAEFAESSYSGFTGPLFDLEAAPNGDILIADSGAGIANSNGDIEISLQGISNIATLGRGSMWAITGAPSPEDTARDIGQGLYRVSNGNSQFIANLFDFDAANNPDGGEIGSNPYSVVSVNGNTALITDAGANDLLRVDRQGNVELVAVFPSELVSTSNVQSLIGCPNPAPICDLPPMIPAEAVPTAVAIGPDGYYYVGELKGFPAPIGESNIWKIAPDTNGAMCGSDPDCIKAFDGGFTSIIDMIFGDDGRLYVAELDAQSWFSLEVGGSQGGVIKSCDVNTMECTTIATGIPMLTAIEFDENGSLWATRNALIPGLAEVFKVME